MRDVIIIGAGPGGLQAAIAAASEGLTVTVLERGRVGGQIGQTPRLENSVFAAGGITGPMLAQQMKTQALAMGAEIIGDEVAGIRKDSLGLIVEASDEIMRARTVVLAMGNKWADLTIKGLSDGIAAGIVRVGPVDCLSSSGAGQSVAVFGGGPSAGQAIVELARKGAIVHVLLRSTLKMPQYLVDRIVKLAEEGRAVLHTNIKVHSMAVVGGQGIIDYGDRKRDSNWLKVSQLYLCNGLLPATDWLVGHKSIRLDSNGRVITSLPSLQTGMPGVYAIGDCRSGSTPRVGVAIGDGSMVVTELWTRFFKTQDCENCKAILG